MEDIITYFKLNGIGNMRERIFWALNPFKTGKFTKQNGKTIAQQKCELCTKEKLWGNKQIGQSNNGNWTTLLGEGLVKDWLKLHGYNPRKPDKKDDCPYQVDWECDNIMVEVKTRNWTTTGTAGEKVFGTMYKYADIPQIYDKPLKIICVAFQEYELTHCNTKIFNTCSTNQQKMLALAESFGITYVRFSDLILNNSL